MHIIRIHICTYNSTLERMYICWRSCRRAPSRVAVLRRRGVHLLDELSTCSLAASGVRTHEAARSNPGK